VLSAEQPYIKRVASALYNAAALTHPNPLRDECLYPFCAHQDGSGSGKAYSELYQLASSLSSLSNNHALAEDGTIWFTSGRALFAADQYHNLVCWGLGV
jgi:hypothetical protein